MRILLAQETDWFEKGPLQQNHLMEKLSLKGHQVRVMDHEILWKTHGERELYSRRRVFDNISRVYRGANVTVIRPSIVKFPHLDYVSLVFSCKKEIDRQIKDFKPDVIVGFQILSLYLAMRSARKNRIPFIYYWTDVYHAQIPFKPYRPLGKLIERRILRSADTVITINEKLRDLVVELGSDPERTYVVRGSVDRQQFNPAINGSKTRECYGIKKDDVVFLFMGWLYNFSGLKEVALQLAKMPNHNLRLLIVGEGDAYNELQKLQKEYNLQDRLILTGKRPYQEIPAFIAAADICLLPAYTAEKIMQDIVPIKMYQYMAMGKPVIATRLPGVMKEFGEDNGVVYVDRPEDVVAKATELVQNSNVERLGSKARSFVESYSWDTITDEFEKILSEAIKEKQNEPLSKRV